MAFTHLVAVVLLLPSCGGLEAGELLQFSVRAYTDYSEHGTVTITTMRNGIYYRMQSNGIPDHMTGTFPGRGNPNSVKPQMFSHRIAVSPSISRTPTCLPMGPIAFSKNGIPIFNPLNNQQENAVEGPTAEVFDSCDGHPDLKGVYHYHQTPDCLYNGGNDEFVGVALDGFPIYGIKDSSGKDLTSVDLDICHGRMENGKYRYRLTRDWPYVLGCFRGTPSPDISPNRLSSPNCMILNSTASPSTVSPSSTVSTDSGGTTVHPGCAGLVVSFGTLLLSLRLAIRI